MRAECQLAATQRVEASLDGTTVVVRAHAVTLGESQDGHIELVESGPTLRCQVLACDTGSGIASRSATLEARFTAAVPVQRVVVEHAGGEETVHLAAPVACPKCGTHNPPDEAFCQSCGTYLQWASSASEMEGPPVPRRSVGRAHDPAESVAAPTAAEPVQPRAGPAGHDARPVQREAPPPPGGVVIGGVGRWLRDALPRLRSAREPELPEMAAGDAEPADEEAQLEDKAALFPRLDAPDYVVVGEVADITIGVRPTEDPKVGGGQMEIPPTAGETYSLFVQLSAVGFKQVDGSPNWEWELRVSPRQPYPTTTIKVVADPIDGPGTAAVLQAIYTVDDQVIGNAKRALAIVKEPAAAADVELPDVAVRRAMALPLGATAADLTVVILMDETVRGRLLWAFRTPHAVATPKRDCTTKIGDTPEAFAEMMRRNAEKAEGKPMLLETMRGVGRMIADKVHPEFWRILHELLDVVGPRPSVLILSEEPYVPWELAVLPKPLFPDDGRFLAAEVVTGRWLLTDGPTMPPPELVTMKAMAVVNGEYETARLRKLEDAKAETEALRATYGATKVHATLADVRRMLRGEPSAEVLHFAIHGRFNSEGADLLMEDGEPLTVAAVRGSELGNAPFVFLNACQVGAANELLGSYAGLAQAFISQGASAVVAPLWSVRDDVAKDLSLRFYPDVFAGERPAEVLRRARASFGSEADPESATVLAYQFYGHPGFRLTR